MILGAAACIKVLLPILTGCFLWLKFKNTLSTKYRVGVVVLCVAFACFANMVAGHVPPLTDTVTLTALGETGQAGKGQEVFITGYTVDGKTYAPQNAVEGKWFWIGSSYCWRPETDSRQPEGTTRSVTLEVPVGWDRTVNFSVNEWRGWVDVVTPEGNYSIDTSETQNVSIGRSQTDTLMKNQLLYLAVYAALLVVLFCMEYMAVTYRTKLSVWNKRHEGVLILAAIALFQLLLAVKYSGIDCLWYDELYEIGWSADASSLLERVFMGHAPIPIYALLFHTWYSVAPYGERWLMLFPEISTSIGIFFVGMCGREWRNHRVGVIAALFAAVSSTILVQCSYEIRSYAQFFASSALLLYLYFRRWRHMGQERTVDIVLLSAAMTFFAGMHYHAVIFCISLFLMDAFLFLRGDIKLKSVIPYFIAAVSYVPSLLCIEQRGNMKMFTANWQPVPTLREINSLFLYLGANSKVIVSAFLLGAAILVTYFIISERNEGIQIAHSVMKVCVPGFLIIFVVGFFIVYGNLINRTATLWQNRYFCGLLPCFLLVAGLGVDELARLFQICQWPSLLSEKAVIFFLCFLILPSSLIQTINLGTSIRQPYRGAAEWLYQQGNYIYNDSTLVLSNSVEFVVDGWKEYYLTRQGTRDPIRAVSQYEVTPEELLQYERIYLVFQHTNTLRSPLTSTLSSAFRQVAESKENHVTVYERI